MIEHVSLKHLKEVASEATSRLIRVLNALAVQPEEMGNETTLTCQATGAVVTWHPGHKFWYCTKAGSKKS